MSDIELERRLDIYISDSPYEIGVEPSFTETLSNIVAGSVSIDRMLAESAISFGSFISDKLEFTVYDTDDLSGRAIQVYTYSPEGSAYIFTGVIDSCKLTGNDVDRKVIAYDYAYSWGKVNIADWYNNFWETRTSIEANRFLNFLVMDVFNSNVWSRIYEDEKIFNFPMIEKTINATSISFGFIMSQISELTGNLYHFNTQGLLLKLSRFSQNSNTITINESDVEIGNSNFEEYQTKDITGVQIEYNGNILGSYGDLSNPYIIKDNIFLISKSTTELNDYCENYYNYIHGSMIYTPSSVKMVVSNLDLIDVTDSLYKWIMINNIKFPILHQTLSGPLLVEQTLSASGNVDRPQSLTTPEDFTINILKESVNEVTEEIAQVRVDLNGKVSTQVATQIANTVFEQNADNFTLTATNGQKSSTLKLSYNGTELASDTIQFTGNVIFASDLTDGTTQISGDNILTGTISAARIDAGHLVVGGGVQIDTSSGDEESSYINLNYTSPLSGDTYSGSMSSSSISFRTDADDISTVLEHGGIRIRDTSTAYRWATIRLNQSQQGDPAGIVYYSNTGMTYLLEENKFEIMSNALGSTLFKIENGIVYEGNVSLVDKYYRKSNITHITNTVTAQANTWLQVFGYPADSENCMYYHIVMIGWQSGPPKGIYAAQTSGSNLYIQGKEEVSDTRASLTLSYARISAVETKVYCKWEYAGTETAHLITFKI